MLVFGSTKFKLTTYLSPFHFSYQANFISPYHSHKAGFPICLFLFLVQMVLDFTATWCGPCKLMDQVLQDLSAEYTDAEFIKIDVEELNVCHSFPFTLINMLVDVKATIYLTSKCYSFLDN